MNILSLLFLSAGIAFSGFENTSSGSQRQADENLLKLLKAGKIIFYTSPSGDSVSIRCSRTA